MQNLSKTHEKNVQTSVHTEQVNNILDNVENVPYALRGSMTKTILYWLFCLIAASELTAALFFYVASLGANVYVAAVVAAVIGFVFHGLLHSILTDTTKGMVFSKIRESKAMSAEVKTNIVLSIILLIMAACTVFFIGKKGFTAYRSTKYETAQNEAKPKGEQAKGIDASMLTGKNGKIAAWKIEALTDLEKAKTKGIEATTASTTANREAYDLTTANITDIVGASAFVLELLLALLAYSIATAKFAAVIDEIARRNGKTTATTANDATANVTTATTANDVTANVTTATTANDTTANVNDNTPSVQKFPFSENNGRTVIRGFQRQNEPPTATTQRQTLTANMDTDKRRYCLHCEDEYTYKIHNQKFCSEKCKIAAWELKTGKPFKVAAKRTVKA